MSIELAHDCDEMRAVPGWEGLYSVTADGRVWSHERLITSKDGRSWRQAGRWLVLLNTASGYHMVHLHRGEEKAQAMVHRLVAEAFLPRPRPDQKFVNHKDSHRTNNWSSNLEWCNQSENVLHGWRVGQREVTPAMRAVYAKAHAASRMFSYEEADAIRARVRAGEKQRHICKETGAAPATICRLVNGDTYTAYATPATTGENHAF